MNSTLEETVQEPVTGPVRRGLRWLDSKLSRVTSSREFIPEIDGLRVSVAAWPSRLRTAFVCTLFV